MRVQHQTPFRWVRVVIPYRRASCISSVFIKDPLGHLFRLISPGEVHEHIVKLLNCSDHDSEPHIQSQVSFRCHIVIGEMDPAILPADCWGYEVHFGSPWDGVPRLKTGDVLKISMDLDILNLFSNSISFVIRFRRVAEVKVRIFLCFHAIDTISGNKFDCLVVCLLAETEYLQTPGSDEDRVHHKAELGGQVEEGEIRLQQ